MGSEGPAKGIVDSLRGGKKRGRRLGKGGKKGKKRKEQKKNCKMEVRKKRKPLTPLWKSLDSCFIVCLRSQFAKPLGCYFIP